MENENILIIKDLDVRLFTDRGELPVIDRLSLTLKAGETLGIVGESGCGKSMLASAIMGLVAHPGKVTGGSIQFEGQELVGMKKKDLRLATGMSTTALAKLGKNQHVSTEILTKICTVLDCDFCDIIELVKEENHD